MGAKFTMPLQISAQPHFNDMDSFAVLDHLAPGSALEGLGVQPGDAVVSVNGRTFNSLEKFVALIYDEQAVRASASAERVCVASCASCVRARARVRRGVVCVVRMCRG